MNLRHGLNVDIQYQPPVCDVSQSRPDSGLSLQVKGPETFQVVPISLARGAYATATRNEPILLQKVQGYRAQKKLPSPRFLQ